MNLGNVAVDGYGANPTLAPSVPVSGYGAYPPARYIPHGYDIAQFYRLGTEQFVLAVGTPRSAHSPYKRAEGWERCSGLFAVPSGGRNQAMQYVRQVWADNKAATSTVLGGLVNDKLNAVAYRRPNGAPVTPPD